MSEKEKLLAVATAEEWDWFLNDGADFHSPRNNNFNIPERCGDMASRLSWICPGMFFQHTPRTDFMDIAIARLEAAGVFDD
jgi:hypothetical protein